MLVSEEWEQPCKRMLVSEEWEHTFMRIRFALVYFKVILNPLNTIMEGKILELKSKNNMVLCSFLK